MRARLLRSPPCVRGALLRPRAAAGADQTFERFALGLQSDVMAGAEALEAEMGAAGTSEQRFVVDRCAAAAARLHGLRPAVHSHSHAAQRLLAAHLQQRALACLTI